MAEDCLSSDVSLEQPAVQKLELLADIDIDAKPRVVVHMEGNATVKQGKKFGRVRPRKA